MGKQGSAVLAAPKNTTRSQMTTIDKVPHTSPTTAPASTIDRYGYGMYLIPTIKRLTPTNTPHDVSNRLRVAWNKPIQYGVARSTRTSMWRPGKVSDRATTI